jgi:RHS repeat-associated protein
MMMQGRSFSAGTGYRYGFNGQEKSNEIKGEGNSYTAEYWEYDPRLGRRWNVDPILKEYESPYSAFSNNPIWNIDPDGADTAKYLTNEQLADGVKIAYDHLRSQTNAKKFKAGRDVSKDLLAKVEEYAKQHNLGFASTIELSEVVNGYYEGLEEVALASSKSFNDLGDKVLNDNRISPSQKVKITSKAIQEYNGKALAIVTAGANAAVGLSAGAVGIRAGAGPRSPVILNSQNSNTARVGQWMSPEEYEVFNRTGVIPRSNVLTNGPAGYERQANKGDFYVTFDINKTLLRDKSSNGNGWALIKSKNQMEIKLAAKKGQTLPAPIGKNIKFIKSKN